jgi:alpha-D-ribose 1-methylphosphonate 5-triphosphate synthase subunit PhnG
MAERQRDLIFELARAADHGRRRLHALVGATAAYHELELATLDRRAVRVYEALGVRHRLLA